MDMAFVAAGSRLMLYDIPVLSELNPYKMECSSSAVNDSFILTEVTFPEPR